MRALVFTLSCAFAASAALIAQAPRTHRLEATPATVAYGHYWADDEAGADRSPRATSSTSTRC